MRKLFAYFILTIYAIMLNSCSEEIILQQDLNNSTVTAAALQEKRSANLQNCDFNLAAIKAGSKKSIHCLIDLKGKTVHLQNNVDLTFDGGDIINGILIFKMEKLTVDF